MGGYLESPHLYHFGEWYYIMAAEGVDGIVCKEMELDIDANPCNCDGKYNVSLDKMDALSLRWCYLREYKEENYKFADGCLSLRGVKAGLSDASFRVVSTNEDYSFYAKCGGEEVFMGKAGTKYLSSEVAGGFTGTVMAMYAVNKNNNEDKWAVFSRLDWEQGI